MPKADDKRPVLKGETTLEAEDAVAEADLEAGLIDDSELADAEQKDTTEEDTNTETVADNHVDIDFDGDMEAAMEEDIAGAMTGVSRRNPPPGAPFGAFTAEVPARSSYAGARSGLEEADWFMRFRERLAAGRQRLHGASTAASVEGTAANDFADTTVPDEAESYSEEPPDTVP